MPPQPSGQGDVRAPPGRPGGGRGLLDFPLPCIHVSTRPSCRSSGMRQRFRRTACVYQRVNAMICELNSMHDPSFCVEDARYARASDVSLSVRDVWARLLRAVRACAAPPPSSVGDKEALLALLGDCASGYGCQDVHRSVVPREQFRASSVALPDGHVADACLLSLLPSRVRDMYASPVDSPVLREPAVARTYSAAQKCFMGVPRSEYVSLVQRLLRLGMVSLLPDVECVNGVFGVWKDAPGGAIRLILDARPCNHFFVQCPTVDLPHPCRLSEVVLRSMDALWVSGIDLSNYYHHLRVPTWMVRYFGLPRVRVADLDLSASELGDLSLSPHDLLFPAFVTLPMGFSHAVSLAQQVHETLLVRHNLLASSVSVSRSECLAAVRSMHLSYIDDLNAVRVGTRHAPPASLASDLDAAAAVFSAHGLPENLRKRVAPTLCGNVLGVCVDGLAGRLCPRAESLARLVSATRALIHGAPASPAQVRRVVGHWTWYMLLRRPALSIFGRVYRYMRTASAARQSLWTDVVCELRRAVTLSPFFFADLRAPVSPVIHAFDASSSGHASVFQTVQLSREVLLHGLSARGKVAVPGRFFLAVSEWRSRDWRIARRGVWRWREHINVGEMRAFLNSLAVHGRPVSQRDSRFLVFGDSSVVCGACAKGRSSSPPLLALLRRGASVQFAYGLFPSIHHVSSADNPADGPSRGLGVWM